MATICTSCMNTDISFQEGARPASLCYKHGCFVALEELITECADFDPNTCWLRQRVKELEAQLAEAHDKLRRIQDVDKNWKWREMITKLQEYAYHYGDDALAEQLDELEIELICQEARIKFDGEVIDDERDKARLQVALDRIEAAGYEGDYAVMPESGRYSVYLDGDLRGKGATAADAAEAAAAWAESQKEGEA